MSRPLKRARTSGVRVARPIDKELKAISQETIAGSQVETALKTTTFPGTIVGLRWSFGVAQDAGTTASQLFWAIVVLPDGVSASTIAISDGADMYTPEQHVLAFGATMNTGVDVNTVQFEGTTKTMRKLKQGDKLVWIALAEATNTWAAHGTIQFFFKT